MASQGQIRSFDIEQDRRRSTAPAAPLGAGLTFTASKGAPGLGATLPKIVTTTPQMDAAEEGIRTEQERLRSYLPGLQAGVDARSEALQGELDKPLPDQPKLMQVPQFQPRQVSQEEMTLFAGVAMALAGLGTKVMRGDLSMALNAAGGAMKGFNEGNLQQARLDMEQFRRQMDGVIAENSRMSEEYRGIIENRKLSLQQKSQALRVAASARDDQVMLSALQTGQYKMIFDLQAHRIDAGNQASLRAATIAQSAQQHLDAEITRRLIATQRSADEPLEPVQQPDGTVRYMRRSAAVGGIVPPKQTGDTLRESEAKGTLFWRQMSSAEAAAKEVTKDFDVSQIGSQIDTRMAQSDWTNWAASEKGQRYAQAAEQWAEAYLRLKTGAATTRDEIKRNARAYFPQPGDEPGTIKQKNEMRAQAIQDVSIVAGRGVDKQPGGGGKSFANVADAEAAARAGKIKAGDRITVGGQSGTWK